MFRLKKIYICLLVVLLAACTFGLMLVPGAKSQTSETQNIKIGNHSYYFDSLGNLVVVGVVQNIGSDTIEGVILAGTATTVEGLQSPTLSPVWVSYLVPQQKAPFYMEFPPPQSPQDSFGQSQWYPGDVADISLKVAQANPTSGYQYPDLKVTSSHGAIGTTGNFAGAYVVTGSIQNTGSQAASNLTVVGTFFNSTGAVVGVGYTNYLEPRTLNPSESLSFQVAALDLNQSIVPENLKITSYELLVQTEGPILQGTAPVVAPVTGAGSGNPNANPTNSQSSTTAPSGSDSNVLGFYAAVVVVAIIAVAAALLLLKKRRKPKQPIQTVKQTPQTPKRVPRSKRENARK